MIWDDKAIARLTELVATGVSYTTIGMKMHITKNAAIGKARRYRRRQMAVRAFGHSVSCAPRSDRRSSPECWHRCRRGPVA